MNINDLHLIDRDAAFPIYAFISDGLRSPDVVPRDYEPGRQVVHGFVDQTTHVVDKTLEERLGPNDIVYIPLYLGEFPTGVRGSNGTHEKLDCYDENLEFLRTIAPKVKGIQVGNAGPELSFKHLFFEHNGNTRDHMMDEMCRFVDETSAIIVDAGGTPVYGPVDWDLAIDAYYCDGKYRDHCNGRGIIQIVYCGFQLFGLGVNRLPEYPIVPHHTDTMFWPLCPRQEGPPWPELTEYLRGYDHIVTGIEFIAGLQRGNDVILAEHGFDAGLCGYLTNPDYDE